MKRNLARTVLITAGLIWGFGFVVNKYVLDYGWHESQLLFVRFFTATIAMFVIYFKKIFKADWYTVKWGLILGVFLFLGFYLQTWGLANTTASKNALITGGYIIMMPLIIYIFERKHVPLKTIIAGIITLIGIGFITYNPTSLSLSVNFGDKLTFAGAVFWAFHMYILGVKAKEVDVYTLMAYQLVMISVLSFIAMMAQEGFPEFNFANSELNKVWIYAMVVGFFASFVAFLFQCIGQKHTNSAEASILIATESFFGPMFGILLLGDDFNWIIATGMVLLFGGIILSELDIKIVKVNGEKIE